MSTVPMTHYTLVGEVLTPLHIGDGTTLTPLEYVVIGDQVIRLRPEILMWYLSENEAWQDYLKRTDIIAWRRWMEQQVAENCPPAAVVSQSKLTKNLQRLYRHLGLEIELQPLVSHPLDGQPYIPGSSLKGSLRTAVIDREANRKLRNYSFWNNFQEGFKNDRGSEFSRKALGCTFATDPFRAIRVSDATLLEKSTQYVGVTNLGLDKENKLHSGNQTSYLEVLLPGSVFVTTLTMATALQKMNENIKRREKILSLQLTVPTLIEACCHYYSAEVMQAEMARFFTQHLKAQEDYQALLETQNHLAFNQFLLRIGRYSHFEYKSAQGFRVLQDANHKTPTREGRSRSLVESQHPLGWVKMTLLKSGETVTINQRTYGRDPIPTTTDNLRVLRDHLKIFQEHQTAKWRAIMEQQAEAARLAAERTAQAQREQAERDWQLAMEAARRARLSPLEVSIEAVLTTHPVQADYITLLQALAKGHWETREEQQAVASFIQTLMQKAKVWKETTQAKNPDKDKSYQRTQEVLKYLKK